MSCFAWAVAERLETTDVRYLSLAATALAGHSGLHRDTAPSVKALLRLCDDCPECDNE
jgi:hypothetical protein